MAATILKVSVLTNGDVLLDGDPVTLSGLAEAMDAGPKEGTAIWYYRENAGGEAPPAAMRVMKLITERRLPVRLSAKSDFSDTVTPETASPLAQTFASMRQRAAQRQLAILRPDGRQVLLPALARETAPPSAVAAVEKLLPPSVQRNVAVIGDTAWTMAEKPNLRDAGSAIPFFGMLMGFATIGHAVWIFDGSTAGMLAAGCRESDLVIVDGARVEALPAGWRDLVTPVMRGKQILAYDRATQQLRKP
ncbi:MAG: hypothetical protein LAP40_28415 [Acidobacteriia bacterium]|nr:hypothetical protein [Terriglobia bacterium]